MARVKDLWFSTITGPNGEKIKKKTARHPDNGGSKTAKRWLAVWIDSDGNEATKAFVKKVDAESYGSSQETDVSRGVYIAPKDARMTVAEWCDTWLKGYGTRRRSTVRQAGVHIAKIKAEFGDTPLSAVRPSHVRSWTARLRREGKRTKSGEWEALSESYVYALHRRLSQIFSDAVHDGLIGKSPCSRRTSPGAGRQRPYVATTEQVWALYDAMPQKIRASVLLGAFVGLRVAEACGLRTDDVDFMRGIVRPAVQYPAQPLKSETSRTAVPIPNSLALMLAAEVARHDGETVLVAADGGQLTPWTLERAIRRARAKVPGLPEGFRFHDLRHYLASLLIATGADVKVVQARLRHASAKTTLDTYGHLWPDRDQSTRAAIDAVITARAEQEQNTHGATQ